MRFGFAVLRLAPADFWAMTPREIAGAMGSFAAGDSSAPSRGGLAELMRRFPDGETNG